VTTKPQAEQDATPHEEQTPGWPLERMLLAWAHSLHQGLGSFTSALRACAAGGPSVADAQLVALLDTYVGWLIDADLVRLREAYCTLTRSRLLVPEPERGDEDEHRQAGVDVHG
jgi:hypothetical protein